MRPIRMAGLALAALALLAGCDSGAPARQDSVPGANLSEARAQAIADRIVDTWESGDAARIKALYAPGIVGYDSGTPAMATDRATWDKLQDVYAAARFDRITVAKRVIQLLDGDVFVVTLEGADASSTQAGVAWPFRCTEVVHREADGRWLIANEHCSVPPKTG